MATVTVLHGTPTALTISLASVATSSTFVAGRESNEVNNTSDLFVDALVEGKITVGTSPTANTQIQIWVWGARQAASSAAIDVIDGADSAETITSVGIRNSFLKLAAVLDVDATTSDRVYPIGAFSVAQLFGGVMPKYWGVWVTHNTGVNLNSTGGNHEIYYTGIKYTVA